MLILGHKLVESKNFTFVKEFTKNTDEIFCIKYNEKLIQKLKTNHKEFAIFIENKNEIFLANALGAKFLIFKDKNLAKFAVKVAEFYLFDSKILFLVDDFKNLEEFYELGVDGVILKTFIRNFS
ncbi:hypothetical protein [Campylobacter sp. US33a]|uniref:Indole-3-glycerol-phosphate synthase n=1 Tax=Campylobacter sp. CCS1377 TaxID=3158229 RepID=A0AAU7E6I2_9BACT|nr:hypothetical protein [Campylobacter sp. US33a]MCW1360617.1 hypothetical protein [Campylobacter jejuni]TEY03581.1 hypothetical protein ELQ16_03260 [Campylobacter sp. US33a]